ncbi:hypothetical protein [Mycobacterium malmoense]|uniref:hypothetical protein n=1 Tax=Mycobacterium malmoense TaxID=1780 RepID=UPI0008F926D9|nr:hypothetical protein [Mycobacterium malmoense]OIN79982.1 hypothetical protein BMG05_14985 [Mycobacterium malmoense]
MPNHPWDQDAFNAALDLIGRTGAKQFEIGYLNENVPVEQADWYAHAQYHGTRVIAEHHRGPVEAAEALARRLLDGGLCTHCGLRIALADFPGKRCRWTRQGDKWARGCQNTHPGRIESIVEAGLLQARGPQRGA